ncbi:hypothetical protein ACWCOP_14035 [Maricaulaceae bacterium MS644]
MSVLAILLPAIAGAVAALSLRARLRALGWLSWLGWTLLGAGAPVLAGQVAALVVVEQAADGVVSSQAAAIVQLLLAAGLAGGLGWAAGALSMRLTGASPSDEP